MKIEDVLYFCRHIFSQHTTALMFRKNFALTSIHVKSEDSQRCFTRNSVIVWHDWHEGKFPDTVIGARIHRCGNLIGARIHRCGNLIGARIHQCGNLIYARDIL